MDMLGLTYPQNKEINKINIEEFSRIQQWMMLLTDKNTDLYKSMKQRYKELKLILNYSDVDITEIDIIKG